MVTFNEAMLSNDRALAIRVGDFTSENIKSANFKYGYITGDDFTPGGTYAGTASILFTSIVESFKKLDVVYPEIGLLVGSKVEWVKMGKYYIDDIKIDRNANTTEIELMDEMFKLNESFKTDLKYPAQIRDVILEIATKTGVTLASDNFGMTAIQQHVSQPTGDKLTFRDVLGQVSQLLGFSCFFNRNGELEVRGLTESGITITADNYFLHGLEKSEVEYQIAGITCEVTNNEKLTVGLQTGRSLEIENPLATQDTLNLLYYALKDIVYYPYDLSYQGHLKLDVGQWVTIKTNKDETLKVPVLYQSFSFSGGLTSTISADSVAGSDAQYTYGSFVTKKIDQKSTQIQAEVQQQLKYADEEFKKVSNEMLQQSLEYQNSVRNELATSKAELETQIDTAKTQAETNAKAYADEINQATAEVAEQANTAVNSLKSDLAKVKTDLTATTSTANDAKTSASEAKQQLTTVANDLSKAKQDLQTQASQLTAQASAQSELTKRVSTVEETANGTKTTVSELSKTVDSNTKNITSVTARTKVVEDDLTSTKTTLSQVKTTADSTSQKTATLETGLNGVKADLTATTTTANTTKTNLANYQASNDKAVANLQSNLQTANGNISSLQTKVEAVPGQITSAVSAVEGKIPTEIGSSNLLRNTAVNADNLKLFGTSNSTISIVTKDGHQTYKIVVSATNNSGVVFNGNAQYYNLIKDRSYTFSFWVLTNKDKSYSFESLGHIQVCNGNGDQVGNDIAHQHTTPVYSTNTIKANTWTKVWCTFKATSNSYFKPYFWYLKTGDEIYIYDMMLNEGKIPLSYTPAVEDTQSDITKLNTTLTQTANGLKQLSTQVTSQGSTITSHTNSINSLTTGLSAKVSQTDFNTLSGRVTTAENNIIAKANELSSKITSVEEKIPTSVGGRNLVRGTANFSSGWAWNTKVATITDIIDKFNVYHGTSTGTDTASNNYDVRFDNALTVLPDTEYTLSFWVKGSGTIYSHFFPSCVAYGINSDGKTTTAADGFITHTLKSNWERYWITWKTLPTANGLKNVLPCRQVSTAKSEVWLYGVKLEKGKIPTDWTPAPEDYDSKLATAQSEIKQTTDSIKASVSALDKSTVKRDRKSVV
jgi:predicted  nucleic acid-binding Zn-ribbon protein